MKIEVCFSVDDEIVNFFAEEYYKAYGITLENPEIEFKKGLQRYVISSVNNAIEYEGEAIGYIVKNAYNSTHGM